MCICGGLEATSVFQNDYIYNQVVNLIRKHLLQANLRFLYQEQNVALFYLLLMLWGLICMCLVYIKQLETLRGGRSPRPDGTQLWLLQGRECEMAEVLMRTCEIP